MSLDNFRNRTIIWDTVNRDFPQPIQIMQGDVNARTLLIKIVDNGVEIDLTGHSLKLTYQYTNNSNSGFIVVPPKDLIKGEFVLVIPTEMTATGVIEANLILLNKDKEQVIVSKDLTFISDRSTVSDLAQEINNNIDDFTKLLLEKMPQVLRSELNDLQAAVDKQGIAISTKANQSDLSTTNKNVATAQETAKQAESASKLATARKLGVNLQSSSFQDFDGTADVTNIGVSGVLPIANGGTSTADGVINTIAYANSADGKDGFTTVYPNLNLLKNTRTLTATSTSLAWNTLFSSSQIYDSTIKSKTGVSAMNFSFSVYVPLNVMVGSGVSIQLKGQNSQAPNVWGDDHNTIICLTNYIIKQSDLGKTIRISTPILKGDNYRTFDTALADTDSITIRQATDTPGFVYSKLKLEEGSTATPYMPSASEVTINDYPKYVGFSNIIKPNKKSSDYKWLPMWLVSIDRATGLLKPAVMGIDYAQAHPVGSVVTNTSSSSSGYSTGKWENIDSAVIGSTTIYYWKRTA